jgi:hypothetical protein
MMFKNQKWNKDIFVLIYILEWSSLIGRIT